MGVNKNKLLSYSAPGWAYKKKMLSYLLNTWLTGRKKHKITFFYLLNTRLTERKKTQHLVDWAQKTITFLLTQHLVASLTNSTLGWRA